MDAIDAEIQELQAVHSERKEELKRLQVRAAALKARPTTTELQNQVEHVRAEVLEKQELFAKLTTADQPLISKEDFAKIKQQHLHYAVLSVSLPFERRLQCSRKCGSKGAELAMKCWTVFWRIAP